MTSFRGYEILEMLPRGGMSTVYKARQLSLDRIVAIKALPPAMGVDAADVEKFMTEARITASLKHPNIVQVYDFGKSEDGVYYFVMEYISGYSVAAWIRRKQYLLEENSLLCGMSVAAAMNYAWEKAGIVHCDIKPDNVIIDGDGTVKVADLGLARSVKLILGQTGSEDGLIFGTPNYISPEQSRGDEPLDCRADIYSLGAMLYHCLTGMMPFQGLPPLEVMDRQISDSIPDPQDVNPRISVWSACLIEKMMAKDRNFRPKDWTEVMRDISNVRSEIMPQNPLTPKITSTVKCSAMRNIRLQEIYPAPAGEQEKTCLLARNAADLTAVKKRRPAGLWRKIMRSAAGAALIVAGWSAIHFARDESARTETAKEIQQPETAPQKPVTEIPDVQDDAEHRAFEKYEKIISLARASPDNIGEVISQFQKLADESTGTKYADMAKKEAQKFEQILGEKRPIMAKLDQKANVLASQNRFLEAAAVYDKYHGLLEKETVGDRSRKAQSFQTKHAAGLEEQQRLNRLAELQLRHVADEIAMILVEDDVSAALWRLNELSGDLPLISAGPEFKNLRTILEKSIGAEQKIIDSFRLQKDQKINVSFLQGPQKLLIRGVQGDLVIAEKVLTIEQGTISLQRAFKVRDLTLDEKTGRIGNGEGPEFALMQTMLAIQDGNYQQAAAAAAGTGPFLSNALVETIVRQSKSAGERRAVQAMAHILRKAGIYYDDDDNDLPDPESCRNALRNRQPAFRRGAALNRTVGQFRARFGSTEVARRYDSVLGVLTNKDTSSLDNTAQALPPPLKPEEQPKSTRPKSDLIAMKMMEQNNGLREDQIVFRIDDSGRIVRTEIVSAHLRDIKALENLTDLQKLVCAGLRQDIWRGSPLIAPLTDLSPLKKMSLRELTVNHTRIKDISALSQMPLTSLNLAHTRVNDLQSLKGMQLQYLDVSFTPVRNIRPLEGLPLAYLDISGTEVSDLSPLVDAPLQVLSAVFTRIKDLEPIRSMPLKRLSVRSTAVTDIAFLRGLPLKYLDLADTDVRDISALRGTGLRGLDLHNTKVKDLNALDRMPLETLRISGSGVRDISPLRNLPLRMLDLRRTNVEDLTPLEDLPIEEIWLDDFYNQTNNEKTRAIITVLQKMPKLKNINGKSLREWTGRNE